ncbi:putative uridine kinase C227.14 [Bradysia coprophila]|uniref:putative uridine kinase C227.14 n=1 Tax=Bradysia coprophila TaxID=38358 RepID=UPI00187DB4EF|nr:putative uridine kinase C227.14 [Bradysia coprophila]
MQLKMSDNHKEFVPSHEVQDIADRIIKQYKDMNSSERLIVGIAGRPGSGKTNLANMIADVMCNRTNNEIRVIVMPMDGYHLYRSELSQLPNSEYAFSRRGAHWTFNPAKLYRDLERIASGDEIRVPSFDHSLKDPKEDDIVIPADARVILVEGNYLLYTDDAAWKRVSEMFQLKIFLECDPMECTERLTRRHMNSMNISREEAMLRAKGSDSKNGDLIDTTKGNADFVCHSNVVLNVV